MQKLEYKVFIYIDLEDSLACVRKLGTLEYSELLKTCFSHLEGILKNYPFVEIYQFLGDAIILMVDNNDYVIHLVQLFYQFQGLLNQIQAIEWHPRFKAGIAGGLLVKEIYRLDQQEQILYLGEAISIAARLEKAASTHQVSLLVQTVLIDNLRLNNEVWEQKLVKNLSIKGLEQPISAYAVCPK